MLDRGFAFNPPDFVRLEYIAKNFPEIFRQSEEISVDRLLEKISVTPPYFAFSQCYRFEDLLIAPVHREQAIMFEAAPITSAETSRHLAILGSCAIGLEQTERHYYIAHKGRIRAGQQLNSFTSEVDIPLYAIALPLWHKGKEAAACTMLVTATGEILFQSKIGYQVISRKVFRRIFRDYVSPTEHSLLNPYKSIAMLENVSIDGNVLTAQIPEITPQMCAGHFDDIPMLPIGVFAYMGVNMIGVYLREVNGQKSIGTDRRYNLVSAELDVYLPVPSGNDGTFRLTCHGIHKGNYIFSWVTRNSAGESVNRMDIALQAVQ